MSPLSYNSMCVQNMNITPETAMIDTVITTFLVSAILTKVILQKQKTFFN